MQHSRRRHGRHTYVKYIDGRLYWKCRSTSISTSTTNWRSFQCHNICYRFQYISIAWIPEMNICVNLFYRCAYVTDIRDNRRVCLRTSAVVVLDVCLPLIDRLAAGIVNTVWLNVTGRSEGRVSWPDSLWVWPWNKTDVLSELVRRHTFMDERHNVFCLPCCRESTGQLPVAERDGPWGARVPVPHVKGTSWVEAIPLFIIFFLTFLSMVHFMFSLNKTQNTVHKAYGDKVKRKTRN